MEVAGISRTNSDQNNENGDTAVMKDPNNSSHGDNLTKHGDGTGDGSGDDTGGSWLNEKTNQDGNGELEKEENIERMNKDDVARRGGGDGSHENDVCHSQDGSTSAASNGGKDVDGAEQVSECINA